MINITEKAAEVIKRILEENNKTESFLRLAVIKSGCGCSGQKYGLYIDDQKLENDIVLESNGIRIVIDPLSYEETKGTTIDYIKHEIYGEGFQILNPNEECNCQDDECSCNKKHSN